MKVRVPVRNPRRFPGLLLLALERAAPTRSSLPRSHCSTPATCAYVRYARNTSIAPGAGAHAAPPPPQTALVRMATSGLAPAAPPALSQLRVRSTSSRTRALRRVATRVRRVGRRRPAGGATSSPPSREPLALRACVSLTAAAARRVVAPTIQAPCVLGVCCRRCGSVSRLR